MSSQDKNLPYEILTLSHFGFKYCSVPWWLVDKSNGKRDELALAIPRRMTCYFLLVYVTMWKADRYINPIFFHSFGVWSKDNKEDRWVYQNLFFHTIGVWSKENKEDDIWVIVFLNSHLNLLALILLNNFSSPIINTYNKFRTYKSQVITYVTNIYVFGGSSRLVWWLGFVIILEKLIVNTWRN